MSSIPDDSPSNPEAQKPSLPVPNVKKITERINSFFANDDLKCRRPEFLCHGKSDSRSAAFSPYTNNDITQESTILEVHVAARSTPGPECVLIARVDFPLLCFTTNRLQSVPWKLPSEVATMRYLKANTTIPIPEIYFYDEDLDNEVGGPWMLMEYIHGPSLEQVLPEMTMQQRRSICESIAGYWNQLLSLRFDAIGSLGFDEKGDTVVGPLSMMCPHNLTFGAPPSQDKCGPFATVREWILAVANSDLRYQIKPEFRKSPEEEAIIAHRVAGHVATLKAESFIWRGAPVHPIALHPPDFVPHNVIVSPTDPTKILAVIDWEGTTTAPIWDILKRPSFDFDCPPVSDQEREELNRMIWYKVAELNPEWADAMANGGSLRNASTLAEVSDWDPEDYKLELPDEAEVLMRPSSRTGA